MECPNRPLCFLLDPLQSVLKLAQIGSFLFLSHSEGKPVIPVTSKLLCDPGRYYSLTSSLTFLHPSFILAVSWISLGLLSTSELVHLMELLSFPVLCPRGRAPARPSGLPSNVPSSEEHALTTLAKAAPQSLSHTLLFHLPQSTCQQLTSRIHFFCV